MSLIDIFGGIIAFLQNQDLVARALLIIFLLLYLGFATLLFIQERALTRVIDQVNFSQILRFLSLLHLLLTFFLLFFTILV